MEIFGELFTSFFEYLFIIYFDINRRTLKKIDSKVNASFEPVSFVLERL